MRNGGHVTVSKVLMKKKTAMTRMTRKRIIHD
jgi:hypothetical protein